MVVLCHHQQAAGVLINAVHNARTNHTIDTGEPVTAVIQQRMYQRSRQIAGGRMYYHAFRLIHHQQIIIFIDNVNGIGSGTSSMKRVLG